MEKLLCDEDLIRNVLLISTYSIGAFTGIMYMCKQIMSTKEAAILILKILSCFGGIILFMVYLPKLIVYLNC